MTRGFIGVRVTSRLIFGLVVIGVGVAFTLDRLGLANAGDLLRWWPLALVLAGVSRLVGPRGSRSRQMGGVFFLVVGGFWLLHNLDLIRMGPLDLWPLILIGIGAVMVSAGISRSRPENAPAEQSACLNSFAVWSGQGRKIMSQEFQGGDVTAIMSGQEIDFRAATLATGTATLDVLVIWGGIDFFVPADWRVSVEATTIMGGILDHTKAPVGPAKGTLVLRGLVLMGGIEIKN